MLQHVEIDQCGTHINKTKGEKNGLCEKILNKWKEITNLSMRRTAVPLKVTDFIPTVIQLKR